MPKRLCPCPTCGCGIAASQFPSQCPPALRDTLVALLDTTRPPTSLERGLLLEELERLNGQLDPLERRVEATAQALTSVIDLWKKRDRSRMLVQSFVSSMRRVPPELWERIFGLATAGDSGLGLMWHPTCAEDAWRPRGVSVAQPMSDELSLVSAFTISHVCRSWRTMAISFPSLWTHIHLGLSMVHPQKMERLCERIRVLIDRSFPRRISLNIDLMNVTDPEYHDFELIPALEDLWLLLLTRRRRWDTVYLQFPEVMNEPAERIVERWLQPDSPHGCADIFSAVRYLAIEGNDNFMSDYQFHLPALRGFSGRLETICIHPNSLTELHLVPDGDFPSMVYIARWNSATLEHLHVHESAEDFSLTEPLILPVLKSLAIDLQPLGAGRSNTTWLEHLHTPVLQSLKIGDGCLWKEISAFVQRTEHLTTLAFTPHQIGEWQDAVEFGVSIETGALSRLKSLRIACGDDLSEVACVAILRSRYPDRTEHSIEQLFTPTLHSDIHENAVVACHCAIRSFEWKQGRAPEFTTVPWAGSANTALNVTNGYRECEERYLDSVER